MAWIKLHLEYDGRDVYVNTNNISAVNADCRRELKEATCISFCGNDENFIRVTESVEEVMGQILWNEALVSAAEDEVLHKGGQ